MIGKKVWDYVQWLKQRLEEKYSVFITKYFPSKRITKYFVIDLESITLEATTFTSTREFDAILPVYAIANLKDPIESLHTCLTMLDDLEELICNEPSAGGIVTSTEITRIAFEPIPEWEKSALRVDLRVKMMVECPLTQ